MAKKALEWQPDTCAKLVELCLARKKEVQADHVPQRVWKEICKSLVEAGYTFLTWQQCQAKFDGMKAYFILSLKKGGAIAGAKLLFYDDFCCIHDLPSGYVAPANAPQEVEDEEEDTKSDKYKSEGECDGCGAKTSCTELYLSVWCSVTVTVIYFPCLSFHLFQCS